MEKETQRFIGAFDGSATPNPGNMIIGGYVCDPLGKIVIAFKEDLGYGTNNEAEYKALIKLISEIRKKDIQNISIIGDSALVVNQINKVWKVKNPRMEVLRDEALSLMEGLNIKLTHVLRDKNKKADALTR